MNRRELQRELQWVKKQSREMQFTLPEREPGEQPVTEPQIRYLKSISKDLDEETIRQLGTRQVASLIDQVKLEREIFTDELIAKRLEEKSGCLGTVLLLAVLSSLVFLLV